MAEQKRPISTKRRVLAITLIVAILGLVGWAASFFFANTEKDFRDDYPKVSLMHPFQPITIQQSIDILREGSDVLFFGFPECPWCQTLVPHIETSARIAGIQQVKYVNVLKDRTDGSRAYKGLVGLLAPHLKKDASGEPRLFVPHVIVVKDGKIVASYTIDTSIGNIQKPTPDTYWTQEAIDTARTQLTEAFQKLKP